MSARTEAARARSRILDDLTRTIGNALSEDRTARTTEQPDDSQPADDAIRARMAAASEMVRLRPSLTENGAVFTSDVEGGLIDEAISRVLGLGRLDALLADDEISDVHIRGNEPVWVRLRDGARCEMAPVVDTDEELVDLVRRACTRLTAMERRFDPANPEVNLQLPDGSRLFAAMAIAQRPTVVIRRHRYEFSELSVLERSGMISADTSRFLAAATRARRNIIIAGGTGTGKTTLLRALLNEVPRHERIVTIEDAYELGLDRIADRHPDHDCLQSRPPNIEGRGEVTLADLARMALRMDPDRVVVGEVRGGEALTMLMAMSQGNNGSMCTLHADSAKSVFPKLAAYVTMAGTPLPVETVNMIIGEAVHFVVHIELTGGARRISRILEVVGADGNSIISNEVHSAANPENSFLTLTSASSRLLAEHGFRPHAGTIR